MPNTSTPGTISGPSSSLLTCSRSAGSPTKAAAPLNPWCCHGNTKGSAGVRAAAAQLPMRMLNSIVTSSLSLSAPKNAV
jgi:hypothetical protein